MTPISHNAFPFIQPQPRRQLFFVTLILAILALITFTWLFHLFVKRSQSKILDESRLNLSKAVVAMTERFNRERWLQQSIDSLLRPLRKKPFSAGRVKAYAKFIAKRLPHARVYVFETTGKLVFQTGNEPQKSRETLWLALLGTHRHKMSAAPYAQSVQRAPGLIRSLFGNLTSINDLTSPNALPQTILEKGKHVFSLVVPQEAIQGKATQDYGGLWILVDPQTLPVRQLGRYALAGKRSDADEAFVISKDHGRLRIDAPAQSPGVPSLVVKKVLQNQTEILLKSGLWMARYIPHENGRYLVGHISADRLQGFWGHYRSFFQWAFMLILIMSIFKAWEIWWRGHLPVMGLKSQIGLLFFITAIVPFAMMFWFGRERTIETERLSMARMQKRMLTTLAGLDASFEDFLAQEAAKLAAIEKRLIDEDPATLDLSRLLKGLGKPQKKMEILIIDRTGKEKRLDFGLNVTQQQ